MTILEYMKQNNIHKSLVEKGKYVSVISVGPNDNPDTIVNDQNTGEPIYMKKVDDLGFEFDPKLTRVFIIGKDQWKKMTTKNLFLSHLKGPVRDNMEDV